MQGGSLNSSNELTSDARYIEPSCHARWHFDEYSRIQCGGPNHLAIHKSVPYAEMVGDADNTNTNDANDANFLVQADKYEELIRLPLHDINDVDELKNALNEQDEYGNTLFHVAVLMGYNTGKYLEMFAIIKTLIKECAMADEDFTALHLKNKFGLTFIELILAIYRECKYFDSNPYGILKFAEHGAYRCHMHGLTMVMTHLLNGDIDQMASAPKRK